MEKLAAASRAAPQCLCPMRLAWWGDFPRQDLGALEPALGSMVLVETIGRTMAFRRRIMSEALEAMCSEYPFRVGVATDRGLRVPDGSDRMEHGEPRPAIRSRRRARRIDPLHSTASADRTSARPARGWLSIRPGNSVWWLDVTVVEGSSGRAGACGPFARTLGFDDVFHAAGRHL